MIDECLVDEADVILHSRKKNAGNIIGTISYLRTNSNVDDDVCDR